jgi:hypothetical protein
MRTATMRARTIIGVLACCSAGLAGCAAAPSSAPAIAVTTPKVGKPPAPASAQAALSSEAFTPYAALGLSSDDGLAPGESWPALTGPCMNAAGYPGVTDSDFIVHFGGIPDAQFGSLSSLAFTYPWGGWGYLGAADAQQYGFQYSTNAAVTALGIGAPPASLPHPSAAEEAAAAKCSTIINNFRMSASNGSAMDVIGNLGNDIYADMARDRAVHAAARAWSACMAKNGYSSLGSPQNVDAQEQQAMLGNNPSPTATVSPAANQAQITAAVTDANCTQSSDLAGIYFAVQASYEQQLVSANRQALTAAVSQYRTAYTKELKRLPALLRTTKARPFPGLGRNHGGGTTGGA